MDDFLVSLAIVNQACSTAGECSDRRAFAAARQRSDCCSTRGASPDDRR